MGLWYVILDQGYVKMNKSRVSYRLQITDYRKRKKNIYESYMVPY